MAVLCVLVLIAPSAYVVQEPGPTQDVLGKVEGKQVIDVSGVKTHKTPANYCSSPSTPQAFPDIL